MIHVTVSDVDGFDRVRWAFSMTAHGRTVNLTPAVAYRLGHSPIRERRFAIQGVWSESVHTHLVRHSIGVNHYVGTLRPDRRFRVAVGDILRAFIRHPTGAFWRDLPRRHAFTANAEALINMARKRLCYKAEAPTRAVMERIVIELAKLDADLARCLVPECVYRNGMCPEGVRGTCGRVRQQQERYAAYFTEHFVRI